MTTIFRSRSKIISFRLNIEKSIILNKICKDNKLTVSELFLIIINQLIYEYLNKKEVQKNVRAAKLFT